MLKAIETIYNGYRFRSRLEARWAVFFDALGIKYEYEKEGYRLSRGRLGSLDYLPDFWLPQWNCWIEIKGQDPTPQERAKAHFLSLHSKKAVYIFAGDIAVPDGFGDSAYLYYFRKATLRHPEYKAIENYRLDALFELETSEERDKYGNLQPEIDITSQVDFDTLDVVSEMGYRGMSVYVTQVGKLEFIEIAPHTWAPEKKQLYIDIVGRNIQYSQIELMDLLKKHPGCYPRVSQNISRGNVWVECTKSGEIRPTGMGACCSYPNCQPDTPRLIEAYTAARQERFEQSRRSH
jgi:hypothetical protein